MIEKFELDGHSLGLDLIPGFARKSADQIQFSICPQALRKAQQARDFVLKVVESQKPTYGINTGFGALSSAFIEKEHISQLQVNLIRSHCTGVGKPLSAEIVRAMMLIQTHSLLKGYSGVQTDIIERLVDFLNHDIIPIVPEKGSVGASGDLAPLSHIAHCLIGEGQVTYQNKEVLASEALDDISVPPISLGPKDGLGLINGTHLMTAQAVLAIDQAQHLFDSADHIAAMSIDALRGSDAAFDPKLHALKPHPGQIKVANTIHQLIQTSPILQSHHDCGRVQDPYSLRCAAQVHGACRQTLEHAKEVVAHELASVTDNPIVFTQEQQIISGGHFHGQALAFVMDYLAMGLAEICNISERRVTKLLNPTFSDLPAFLAKESGLHSGLMIAQYTSASLVSENKILCHPASVDSISTSNDKEDHVSMGPIAGRKLWEVIQNTYHCLAIEALCAAEAIELLRPLTSSPCLEDMHALIRQACPVANEDRFLQKDIQSVTKLLQDRAFSYLG